MAPNEALVAIFQKRLIPHFPQQQECKPWWWPRSPGRHPQDWGLTDGQVAEYASLSTGTAKTTSRSARYEGFAGSVAATEGAAWLLSIRPSRGTFARSVGPLYTAMLNFANGREPGMVPELHVTDLVKFRGDTAATQWTSGLTREMLTTSIECLYDEYLLLRPPVVLVVDWAAHALEAEGSPLCKTSPLRNEWRSDSRLAHLDAMLSDIRCNGVPVPFWGQGNQLPFMRALDSALRDYRKFRSR